MKQHIDCNFRIDAEEGIIGNIRLKPNTDYKLIIDYPLSCKAEFIIKCDGKGLDLQGLVKKIINSYYEIYENEKKYGIWGHDIVDLYLEGITVDHSKKIIILDMGS